jgi:hypothetical protein
MGGLNATCGLFLSSQSLKGMGFQKGRLMNPVAKLTFLNIEVEAEANVEEEITVRYRHLEK